MRIKKFSPILNGYYVRGQDNTMGNLMAVKVHTAQIHDSKAAKLVLIAVYKNRVNFPRIKVVFADKGYRGKLSDWIKNTSKYD